MSGASTQPQHSDADRPLISGGIRWIVFDAVGTLIHANPPVAQVYCRTARECGIDLDEAEVRRRFRAAYAGEENDTSNGVALWDDPAAMRTDEARERQRWREIVAEVLGEAASGIGPFERLFEHFGRPEAWACYPDVAAALNACRAAGYRLTMASNFDRRLESVQAGLPELAPIEVTVISSLVGYRKPSRHFYEGVATALGCSPAELLMVGDDELNDCRGARNAGLHAIHLDRGGHCGAETIASLTELADRLPRHRPGTP